VQPSLPGSRSRQAKDRCWERAVGAVTMLWAGRTESQDMQEVSLLHSRPDRLFDPPKQPTTQLIPGTLSPQIKRTGSEPDNSHPSPRLQIRVAIPLLPHAPSQRPQRQPYFTWRKINHTEKPFFFPKNFTVRIIYIPDDLYVQHLC
jgi:hypothetical protein